MNSVAVKAFSGSGHVAGMNTGANQYACLIADCLQKGECLLLVVAGMDGRILHLNHSCQVLTGMKDEEAVGKHFWDLFDTITGGAPQSQGKNWMGLTYPVEMENCHIDSDGRRRFILWKCDAIKDESGGSRCVMMAGLDMTERKRSEKRLYKRMAKLKRRITKSMAIASAGKTWDGKNESLHGLLAERLISVWGKMAAPAPVDVSEDLSELEVLSEELSMASAVFEKSNEAMVITDADGSIRCVNPAFSGVTGYSAGEVIGRGPAILWPERQESNAYHELTEHLVKSLRWQGEALIKRKSGQVFPAWVSVSTIDFETGSGSRSIILISDITERKLKEETERHYAYHDPLTGLPNRRLFYDRLNLELARARRERGLMAVMFIDLDRFKQVNDNYGHETGDKLLIAAAERLTTSLRDTDTISRLGGDEFTVLFPNIHSEEDTAAIAMKIVSEFNEPFVIDGIQIMVTVSAGLSLYPDNGADAETLIKKADDAMFAAKREGRNSYKICSNDVMSLSLASSGLARREV
ncbi:MAG: diguanylate cyclase [Nitrospinae bacterium]|nr:diguanylate cyclase [Nitrospinota bacterium]